MEQPKKLDKQKTKRMNMCDYLEVWNREADNLVDFQVSEFPSFFKSTLCYYASKVFCRIILVVYIAIFVWTGMEAGLNSLPVIGYYPS